MSKTKKMVLLLLNAAEMWFAYRMYKGLKEEAKAAYRKGRTDCVDDFVKGFCFCNGDTITVESEHNGSIVVKVMR